MPTATWRNYKFNVYEPGPGWHEVPAVYIFARRVQGSSWIALYIGETDNLRTRLTNHEKWPAAVQLKASHIHTRRVDDREQRLQLETYLRQEFDPPLNLQ